MKFLNNIGNLLLLLKPQDKGVCTYVSNQLFWLRRRAVLFRLTNHGRIDKRADGSSLANWPVGALVSPTSRWAEQPFSPTSYDMYII